ncbi:MAG: DNA-3-methyladenine glycosylase family protein [Candidatus Krumholzibacteriia bacterium]
MNPGDFDRACEYLARCDPTMRHLIAEIGPCRLRRARSYFVALFESIVWQQLSWKAACAIHRRLLRAIGGRHPKPADFLRVSSAQLIAAGLSRRKAEYVVELARYFESDRFPRREIRRLSDEEIVSELTRVRGIGRWSAEMFLIFGLNRPDVFPLGDLGLRKAIERHYRRPGDTNLAEITDRWRPYRTVATWYLWAGMDGVPTAGSAG